MLTPPFGSGRTRSGAGRPNAPSAAASSAVTRAPCRAPCVSSSRARAPGGPRAPRRARPRDSSPHIRQPSCSRSSVQSKPVRARARRGQAREQLALPARPARTPRRRPPRRAPSRGCARPRSRPRPTRRGGREATSCFTPRRSSPPRGTAPRAAPRRRRRAAPRRRAASSNSARMRSSSVGAGRRRMRAAASGDNAAAAARRQVRRGSCDSRTPGHPRSGVPRVAVLPDAGAVRSGAIAAPGRGQTAVDSTAVSRDKKDHIALSDAHNSRGIELADRGWLDEAIKEFKKAIELDPSSAHAHDNLATVYSEKKLYREALDEYLTAHPARAGQRHRPLQPRLLPRDPRAGHGGRRVPGGDRAGSRVPRRAPEPRPHLRRPGQARGGGEGAAAPPSSSTPKDPFPRHELAALLMDEGDYRAAIAQLKEVVRLEPENFEAQLDLGHLLRAEGLLRRGGARLRAARGRSSPRTCSSTTTSPRCTRCGASRATRSRRSGRRSRRIRRRSAAGSQSDPMFDALKGTPRVRGRSRARADASRLAARRATSTGCTDRL